MKARPHQQYPANAAKKTKKIKIKNRALMRLPSLPLSLFLD